MTHVAGSQDPRQPSCHGFTRQGAETLRAVQVSSHGGSSGRAFGKLRTFAPDDPDYNPNDSALGELHCRVKAAPRPNGSG
jgi:hypothetical protein